MIMIKPQNILKNTFINESEIIKQARLQGEKLYAGMQISPIEAKLLQVVIKMVNAKKHPRNRNFCWHFSDEFRSNFAK